MMNNFKVTRGVGWNVFLSADRLFIVDVDSGARRADFEVEPNLLDALRKALTKTDRRDENPIQKSTTVDGAETLSGDGSKTTKKRSRKKTDA